MAPLLIALVAVFERAAVWPMLAADIGVVLAALTDAWLARPKLVTVERRMPRVLSLGRPSKVVLEVVSRARRTLVMHIAQDLYEDVSAQGLPARVVAAPRGTQTCAYHLTPTRRGAYEVGAHTIRYMSPLGLWIRQVRIEARDPVRVYPDVKAVNAYELLARSDRKSAVVRTGKRKGGESEFDCLREYSRDDEYKTIDWKATARRHKLTVRQYRLEEDQNVLFLLDSGRLMTAEVGGLPLFDHALNSTLLLAHVAARGGDRVGMATFAERLLRWVPPTRGKRALNRLVTSGFDVHATLQDSDFATAGVELATRLKRRSLIVLFTQVLDDVAADAVVRSARVILKRHLLLCVLFRDPDVEALAVPPTGPAGAGLYVQAAAAEVLAEREQLLKELKRAGALVLDVAPTELTPALVGHYLEVKTRRLL